MKSFIYFLRWIIGTLSAIASFLLLCIAVEWLIPRIFFFIFLQGITERLYLDSRERSLILNTLFLSIAQAL